VNSAASVGYMDVHVEDRYVSPQWTCTCVRLYAVRAWTWSPQGKLPSGIYYDFRVRYNVRRPAKLFLSVIEMRSLELRQS